MALERRKAHCLCGWLQPRRHNGDSEKCMWVPYCIGFEKCNILDTKANSLFLRLVLQTLERLYFQCCSQVERLRHHSWPLWSPPRTISAQKTRERQYGLMSWRITDAIKYCKMRNPLPFNTSIHLNRCRQRLPSFTTEPKLYPERQKTPCAWIVEAWKRGTSIPLAFYLKVRTCRHTWQTHQVMVTSIHSMPYQSRSFKGLIFYSTMVNIFLILVDLTSTPLVFYFDWRMLKMVL